MNQADKEFLTGTVCISCPDGHLQPILNQLAYKCDTCGQRYTGILEPREALTDLVDDGFGDDDDVQ